VPRRAGADWPRVALALLAVGWGGNAFSPLLVVYERDLGVGATALAALFAVYAAGLVPGLLAGGVWSDAVGRRSIVLGFTALSPVASALTMLAPVAPWTLVPGRALAGVASGVVFAAGSAWMAELALRDGAPAGAAPRRTALALSAGFAVGPLTSAAVAAVAPAPLVLGYVPHLVVAAAAIALLRGVRETPGVRRARRRPVPAAARTAAFWRDVGPLAPWVFACATVSFAVLPVLLGDVPVAVAGLVTAGTLGAGIAVQPVARRLASGTAGAAGLGAAAGGLALGALAVGRDLPVLLALTTPVLGAAYGLLLVTGLRLTERHADPSERGALLAIFYALTYAGFAAPSVLDGLAAAVGTAGALALAAAGAAAIGLGRTAHRRGEPR
jgi:hypothetical protein